MLADELNVEAKALINCIKNAHKEIIMPIYLPMMFKIISPTI